MDQLAKTDNSTHQKLIKTDNSTHQICQIRYTPTYQTIQLTKQTSRPAKLIKSAYQIAKIIKSTNSAHTVYLISHQSTVLPTL